VQNLGFNYNAEEDGSVKGYFFDDIIEQYGDLMDLQNNHYGIDKLDQRILYLPENIKVDLYKTEIKWQYNGATCVLKLLPDHFYVLPNGDRFHIERHPEAPIWKLVGTEAEGTFLPQALHGFWWRQVRNLQVDQQLNHLWVVLCR